MSDSKTPTPCDDQDDKLAAAADCDVTRSVPAGGSLPFMHTTNTSSALHINPTAGPTSSDEGGRRNSFPEDWPRMGLMNRSLMEHFDETGKVKVWVRGLVCITVNFGYCIPGNLAT